MSRLFLSLCALVLLTAGCGRVAAPPPTNAPEPDGRSTVNNGSDLLEKTQGAAWFLGDRAIRYCYEMGTNFGVSERSVRAAIQKSFGAWAKYIDSMGINDPEVYSERFSSREGRALAIRTAAMDHCDGTEDLKFFLGTGNSLTEAVGKRYSSPAAFAHRTSYDGNSGWGKGFIWVAEAFRYGAEFPAWPLSHRGLGVVLTHELGHVLGCAHLENTIMDERIGELVRLSPRRAPRSGFTESELDQFELDIQPEHGRELVHCENCSGTPRTEGEVKVHLPVATMLMSWVWDMATSGIRFPAFALIQSITRLSLVIKPEQPKEVGGLNLVVKLDGVTRVRLDKDPTPMFKVVFRSGNSWVTRESRAEGLTYSGYLLDSFEEKHPAILSSHVAGHLFGLRYWDGRKMVKLLEMDYASLSSQFGASGN